VNRCATQRRCLELLWLGFDGTSAAKAGRVCGRLGRSGEPLRHPKAAAFSLFGGLDGTAAAKAGRLDLSLDRSGEPLRHPKAAACGCCLGLDGPLKAVESGRVFQAVKDRELG
jgi:hypothetical protein